MKDENKNKQVEPTTKQISRAEWIARAVAAAAMQPGKRDPAVSTKTDLDKD